MIRLIAALTAVFVVLSLTPAEAKHRKHRHHYHTAPAIQPYRAGAPQQAWEYREALANETAPQVQITHGRRSYGRENVSFLPHPAGCPAIAFCGCGASVEVFGHSIRSLWLAAAWLRFPRTAPAPGMAAVRPHHVFVLRSHVRGDIWLTADYNSGGHRSRLQEQSISHYTIVNPHGAQYASR